jgi:hypothetical protein
MKNKNYYSWLFWGVALLIAVSKVIFTLRPEINLFTEEAQYWLWSQNLEWHYYSKPPLIAVFNKISTSIFGITEIGVRINAILLGLGTSWIVFLFSDYLYKSKKIAFWAAILVMCMPFWILFSTFHLTDSELVFFWTLSLYWLYRGLKEQKRTWWILAGLASSFGLMAKSIMIVIGPMVLVYLLWTRQWNKNKYSFLLFLLLGAIGFLPGFIWNWQNDFITYRHLASLGGVSGSTEGFQFLTWMARLGEYLVGQLAMISVFFIPIFFYSAKSLKLTLDSKTFFILLPVFFSWLGFGLLTIFSHVEVNWPAFAYVTLPIFMSKWVSEQSFKWEKVRNAGIAFSLSLPLIFFLPGVFPLKNIELIKRIERNSFKRLAGYLDLGERIDFLKDSLVIEQPFIFSETYHMASSLAFYLEDNPQTYAINMGARKNQFDLWEGIEKYKCVPKKAIFVSWNLDSPDEVTQFEQLLYEENFEVKFRGDSLRTARIQVFENLLDYTPVRSHAF